MKQALRNFVLYMLGKEQTTFESRILDRLGRRFILPPEEMDLNGHSFYYTPLDRTVDLPEAKQYSEPVIQQDVLATEELRRELRERVAKICTLILLAAGMSLYGASALTASALELGVKGVGKLSEEAKQLKAKMKGDPGEAPATAPAKSPAPSTDDGTY